MWPDTVRGAGGAALKSAVEDDAKVEMVSGLRTPPLVAISNGHHAIDNQHHHHRILRRYPALSPWPSRFTKNILAWRISI